MYFHINLQHLTTKTTFIILSTHFAFQSQLQYCCFYNTVYTNTEQKQRLKTFSTFTDIPSSLAVSHGGGACRRTLGGLSHEEVAYSGRAPSLAAPANWSLTTISR